VAFPEIRINFTRNNPTRYFGYTRMPKRDMECQRSVKLPPLVKKAIVTFLFKDHVVHDHTCIHHLSHGLMASCSSRVTNNNLPRLKHTKCLLHIVPTRLLLFRKPPTFLFFRVADCLHKGRPSKIDAII
jgi:hypothetical protein